MTAASGLTAIDMRVQPSWRWSEDGPLPVRAPTLKGYDRVYGAELRNQHSHANLGQRFAAPEHSSGGAVRADCRLRSRLQRSCC